MHEISRFFCFTLACMIVLREPIVSEMVLNWKLSIKNVVAHSLFKYVYVNNLIFCTLIDSCNNDTTL